jgi:membrane fusion protein, multidrug efflux system
MRIFVTIFSIVLLTVFFVGFVPRLLNQHELKTMQKETVESVPVVRTIEAIPAPFEEAGFLPGNISAFQYASINARVDGYLKSRLVDIGDHVKTGQLLAEIDTPTVDQEVAQAQADLAQAKAQQVSAEAAMREAQAKDQAAQAQIDRTQADKQYASITANRWENMANKGAVSLQSRDEKVRALAAQTANLSATQAEKLAADQQVAAAASQINVAKAEVIAKLASLKRYSAQQAFKFVRAPFEGIITLRKVDPGALITAGSQSQNLELFQLAKIDDLRIYVNVPQTVARYMQKGQPAKVSVPEFPERSFDGTITNISGALDPQTRTLQTEVRVVNSAHTLLPGMYARVNLTVQRPESWLRINSNAIVPLDNGENVVVIKDNKAHYRKVFLGRDFGDMVEIKAGLNAKDVVVVSPPVDLQEGETVKPIPLDTK